MDTVTVDTRGLACPLPVLKVRKAVRPLPELTRIEILATDPGAEDDLRAYCEASGCRFVSATILEDGVLFIVIEKS